jgi:hypothetical protein
MRLIGLTGRAGSGKDTVANFLTGCQGFVRIGIADPMEAALLAMFAGTGITAEHFNDRMLKEQPIPGIGRSGRQLKQTIGDWGRQVSSDLWIYLADRKLREFSQASPLLHIQGVVVSDVRKVDEANWITRHGGRIWYIARPEKDRAELAGETASHSTEQEVDCVPFDIAIRNTGSIEDLFETVTNALYFTHPGD